MRFEMDEERQLLRDAVGKAFDSLHRMPAPENPFADVQKSWDVLREELALFSMIDAETDFEAANQDIRTIFEEAGRSLLRVPILDSLVVAPILLDGANGKYGAALRQQLANGTARIGFAWREHPGFGDPAVPSGVSVTDKAPFRLTGTKYSVPGGTFLTHLLVTACAGGAGAEGNPSHLLLVVPTDCPGVRMEGFATIDGIAATNVHFDDVVVEDDMILHRGSDAESRIHTAVAHATAAICAEAVGNLRQMIELATRHVTERMQFGKTISQFQVIQHRLADMLIHLEMANGATLRATHELGNADQRDSASLAARVVVGRACQFVGENAVQLHGGMGIAEETAVGTYFKRSMALASWFGTPAASLSKLAPAPAIKSLLPCDHG